jgi:hypothetical protein
MNTISKTNFIFTRYLYEKDEVKNTLLFAILKKNREEAMFWACELFYSGFLQELVELMWKIYYDFYATLNPTFEKILLKIIENHLLTEKDEGIINTIIQYFVKLPFNVDTFILDQLIKNGLEKEYLDKLSLFSEFKETFNTWLESSDYFNVALYILEDCKDSELDDIMEYTILYFMENTDTDKSDIKKKINQINHLCSKNKYNKRKIILTRIMGFYSVKNNLTLGQKITTVVLKENNDKNFQYKTVSHDTQDGKPFAYKILRQECKYSIDSNNYLGLFHLKRDTNDIKEAYLNDWLYFASFSPIWKKRIYEFRGLIDTFKKKVIFTEDDYDNYELFHNKYNYEPDEQTKEVQNRSIQTIKSVRTWKSFYEENNTNCLIDLDSEYLSDIKKIYY